MRKTWLLISIAFLIVGCASVSNAPNAECKKQSNGYLLTVYGVRNNMTHSIIMFLLKPTYEAKLDLLVPRIQGTLQGGEVVRLDDPTENFSGSINFSSGLVELSLLHGSVRPQVPLDWNGRYQLSQCEK